MKTKLVYVLLLCVLILLVVSSFSGCSPTYVARAAYEQVGILSRRKPIDKILQDSKFEQDIRLKLAYVKAARLFAEENGLKAGKSYTYFSRIDREVFSWVLLAARPDKFSLYTWWFPILGTVPYKGFFDRDRAGKEAKKIENKGYETSIRPAQAYSSLGWFNDPVLSTSLSNSVLSVVDTVTHEILHSNIWIHNHIDYNESLANFVGVKMAQQFFASHEWKDKTCRELPQHERHACYEAFQESYDLSRDSLSTSLLLSEHLQELYRKLTKLYESDLGREQVLEERDIIFQTWRNNLRSILPSYNGLSKLNNADLMQVKLYFTNLSLFNQLFECSQGSWSRFFESQRQLAKELEDIKPFDELQKIIQEKSIEDCENYT